MSRTLPKQKLAASPLVHVLAQVRFSPVFDVAERAQVAYERLRTLGFPRYAQSQISEIQLVGSAEPRVDHLPRWDFLNRDRRAGVILTRDFVLLQTSAYLTFDEFIESFREVLQVVRDVLNPPLVERIGLRYVNLVQPLSGESFSRYLQAGLVGFDPSTVPALRVHASLSRVETVMETSVGRLSVRAFQRNDGTYLPPDLWPTTLVYDRAVPVGEAVSLLDLDHSTEEAFDFDVTHTVDSLWVLHDVTDLAFRHAVTPFALEQWGQEPSQ